MFLGKLPLQVSKTEGGVHQKYENAAVDYVMITSPFLIPIQNYHSSGHFTWDIELNIDFGYCLQIYDVIIT